MVWKKEKKRKKLSKMQTRNFTKNSPFNGSAKVFLERKMNQDRVTGLFLREREDLGTGTAVRPGIHTKRYGIHTKHRPVTSL